MQAGLSFYLAWAAAESTEVGKRYEELVTKLRRVAGSACHDARLDTAPSATRTRTSHPARSTYL